MALSIYAVTTKTPELSFGPDAPIRTNKFHQYCLNIHPRASGSSDLKESFRDFDSLQTSFSDQGDISMKAFA